MDAPSSSPPPPSGSPPPPKQPSPSPSPAPSPSPPPPSSSPAPATALPPSSSSPPASAPSSSPPAAAARPPPPVGQPVSLALPDGSSVRGHVHAVDAAAGLVCLEEVSSGAAILVPLSSIASWAPLDAAAAGSATGAGAAAGAGAGAGAQAGVPPRRWPARPVVDVLRVRAEEDRTFRRRHAEFAQVGVGVSPAAQAIFDALAKTLPCKWHRDTIVILDTVHLAPPYDARSLSGDADSGVVSRVRMILDREGAAIKLAAAADAAPAAAAAAAKASPASVAPAASPNGVAP